MILKVYNEDQDEDEVNSHHDSDEAPELITSREDFSSMVNNFLNDFEIVGRKMKPKLEGESGPEKLDVLRRAMGQDERVRISNDGNEDDNDDLFSSDEEDKKDRWDCETILCESFFFSIIYFKIIVTFQQHTQTLRTTPVSSAFLIQSKCQRLLLIVKQAFLPSLTRRNLKTRSL